MQTLSEEERSGRHLLQLPVCFSQLCCSLQSSKAVGTPILTCVHGAQAAASAILAAPTFLAAAEATVGAFSLPALSGTALSAITALSNALPGLSSVCTSGHVLLRQPEVNNPQSPLATGGAAGQSHARWQLGGMALYVASGGLQQALQDAEHLTFNSFGRQACS